MTRSATYPLRLPQSVKQAVSDVSEREGISMNQFINQAVAEKLAVLNTVRFFQERQDRADMARFRQVLNRPGGEPPQAGDELPA